MAEQLELFLQSWNLRLDSRPWQTPSSFLAFVRRGATRCVLKLPRSDDEKLSGLALLCYGGRGAVDVLEYDAASGALLMERVEPGEPLSAWVVSGLDEAAIAVICDAAQDMHAADFPGERFPTVEAWGLGFGRYRASGKRYLPAALVDDASRIFVELASSQGPRRLLHGDLHHGNILNGRGCGWLAIDPKGVIGETACEFGAALRNPADNPALYAERSVIERRADMTVASTAVPRERILGWAFAQAVLSAIWDCEDRLNPRRSLTAAEAIRPLL